MDITYSSAQMAITFCLCRCSNWFSKAKIVCQARGNQESGRDKIGDNPVGKNADALRGVESLVIIQLGCSEKLDCFKQSRLDWQI